MGLVRWFGESKSGTTTFRVKFRARQPTLRPAMDEVNTNRLTGKESSA